VTFARVGLTLSDFRKVATETKNQHVGKQQVIVFNHKVSNYRGIRYALSVEILSTYAQMYENSMQKACNRWITLKVIQGHRRQHYWICNVSLSISRMQ